MTTTLVGHNRPLYEKAQAIRRTALEMGKVQGQGYIAQALDVADILAVAYFHAMTYRPKTRNGKAETVSICRSAITRSRSTPR